MSDANTTSIVDNLTTEVTNVAGSLSTDASSVSSELSSTFNELSSKISGASSTSSSSVLPETPADLVKTGMWTEPPSAATVQNPPQYPYNNITKTQSGHTFELDDTPGRERVRLNHRSKTFLEFHPNGDAVYKVFGNGYEIHMKGKNVLIKGTCNITVEGNCNMEVKGDMTQTISGDYNVTVGKQFHLAAAKGIKLDTDDDISLDAGKDFSGSIYLHCPNNVFINSDLNVDGSISGDLIISTTRVDAGTGVSAGIHGVFSKGPVTALLPISSAVSCSAPTGTWGFCGSVLMSDIVNSVAHNFHTHPAPDGTTGTSTIPFV